MNDSVQPHVPVMADRVVELLVDAPPGVVVDCTLGAGGHARCLLEARTARHGSASLVGLDRDPDALRLARERLTDLPSQAAVWLVHASFEAFDEVLDPMGIGVVAGVLYDLGMSSMHVDRAERGFSYRHRGPLDMRMDPTQEVTAAQFVNAAPREELARVIGRFGEERFAHRIAAAIVRGRPFETTDELAATVRDAIPAAARRSGPHPATRTFQALRIAVNRELEALEASLPRAIARLAPGGVCVVLSYHSLEDRITKQVFSDAARGCICPPGLPACLCDREPLVEVLTRRPERPSESETAANPRARAARLRAARRRAPAISEEAPREGPEARAGGLGMEGPEARAGGLGMEGPEARAGGQGMEGPEARAGGRGGGRVSGRAGGPGGWTGNGRAGGPGGWTGNGRAGGPGGWTGNGRAGGPGGWTGSEGPEARAGGLHMSAVPLHQPSSPPPAPTPPRLRLVRAVPRRRKVAFAMLLSSISTVAVFATVALNALAAGDAVAARQAEEAVEAAESRYTELVAKVAKLEDPARIERVAMKELGMIPARGTRFLVVERPFAEDHAAVTVEGEVGAHTDLKPVLSVQR